MHPRGIPRAIEPTGASYEVRWTFKGTVPRSWDREISTEEFIEAMERTGHARRAGPRSFEILVRDLPVRGTWGSIALRAGEPCTFALHVSSGGWAVGHLRDANEVLQHAVSSLILIDGDELFAAGPRSPTSEGFPVSGFRWLVAEDDSFAEESVSAALSTNLLAQLAGAGDANVQVRAVAAHVDVGYRYTTRPSIEHVELSHGRLTVTSREVRHALEATAAYLDSMGNVLWSPGRWPAPARSVPPANSAFRWVALVLLILTIASWALPSEAGFAVLGLALLIIFTTAGELHRRRVPRRVGGLPTAVVFGLIAFACAYVLCGDSGVKVNDGSPESFGEYMLVSLSIASTGGPSFELTNEPARFVAYIELLFALASLGAAIRLGWRAAQEFVAAHAPEFDRWLRSRDER